MQKSCALEKGKAIELRMLEKDGFFSACQYTHSVALRLSWLHDTLPCVLMTLYRMKCRRKYWVNRHAYQCLPYFTSVYFVKPCSPDLPMVKVFIVKSLLKYRKQNLADKINHTEVW